MLRILKPRGALPETGPQGKPRRAVRVRHGDADRAFSHPATACKNATYNAVERGVFQAGAKGPNVSRSTSASRRSSAQTEVSTPMENRNGIAQEFRHFIAPGRHIQTAAAIREQQKGPPHRAILCSTLSQRLVCHHGDGARGTRGGARVTAIHSLHGTDTPGPVNRRHRRHRRPRRRRFRPFFFSYGSCVA